MVEAKDVGLEKVLAHPVRVELVGQLWHRGEAASAVELQPAIPDVTVPTVTYHLRRLEDADVIEAQGDAAEPARRSYVVGGDNAAEAVRRLELS